MELLLNPADNPLVYKGEAPGAQLPVFSFSVDRQYLLRTILVYTA